MKRFLIPAPLKRLPRLQQFHLMDDPVEIRLLRSILFSQGNDIVFPAVTAFQGGGIHTASRCREAEVSAGKIFLDSIGKLSVFDFVGPSPYFLQALVP